MSIPLQHSEREGWSRTAPDDARRVTGFSPEFVPGGDFTLGAEEEALLVQRNGRLRTTGAVRTANGWEAAFDPHLDALVRIPETPQEAPSTDAGFSEGQ